MTDITITTSTTTAQVKSMEAAALAAGRGRTADAPLRVKIEAGTHDLLLNQIPLKAPYRVVDARGAVFKGTGTPRGNKSLEGMSEATSLVWEGGEVVGADVQTLVLNVVPSEQLITDVVFRNFSGVSVDGLGSANAEGSTLVMRPRSPGPTKDKPWITRIERCQFIDWVGVAITHPIYIHGRPAELHVSDSIFAGGNECSALKSTRTVNTIRRCKFYSESRMMRGELPLGGKNTFVKFIDINACNPVVVTDCEFHGAKHGPESGVTHMIALRNRRSLLGTDYPAGPDVHYERGVNGAFTTVSLEFVDSLVPFTAGAPYATLNGRRLILTPESTATGSSVTADNWRVRILPEELQSGVYLLEMRSDDGVKRQPCKPIRLTVYRDADYLLVSSFLTAEPEHLSRYAYNDWWDSLGDLSDPANPHTFKHWISGNRFVRWHNPAVNTARRVLRAIWSWGVYPITDVRQFSTNNLVYPAPERWKDISTTFLYGNTFEGWTDEEMPEIIGSQCEGVVREGFDIRYGINATYPSNPPPPTIVNVEPEIEVSTRRPSWFQV